MNGSPSRDVVSPAINSALKMQRQRYELNQMRQSTLNLSKTNKNIDADTALKMSTTMDRDTNVKEQLERIAKMHDERYAAQAGEGLTRQKWDTEKAETMLRNYQINRARNLSDAQHSWFMREVAPYWDYGIDAVIS